MDRTTPSTLYTYADLRRIHLERLQAAHKSKQELLNHTSALKLFISVAGKTDTSACENDLTDSFEANIARLADLLTAKGLSAPSIANKLSYLRALRDTYKVMISGLNLSGEFQECLLSLMKSRGLNQFQLARAIGASRPTINSWISRGKIPKALNRPVVTKMECFFGVSEGVLLNKINFTESTYDTSASKAARLESRLKRHALTKDAYYYREPNELILNEWGALLNFYTAPYLLNGLIRNATWRVKAVDRVSIRYGWESLTPNGVCATAHIRWRTMASFFGFLLRPIKAGGKGMREEQLTLALLSDSELFIEFIEFRRQRSGTYTGEIEGAISFVSSLIKKTTGFLRQQAKFGERLPRPILENEWDQWCDKNHNVLRTIIKDLKAGGHIQKGRDPQEPIKDILAQQSPIQILVQMVERMKQQYTLPSRKLLLAIRKRNIVLMKMMISNPLRVHHFSIMSYSKDNKGNLYQDASGAWRIRYQPDDFKNQRGAASGDYDITLPPWIYEDIEEYLTQHRPRLALGIETDRVFLPVRKNKPGKNPGQWGPEKITNCVRLITSVFIPGCPGFGAHAFRHIVATDYIINPAIK